MKLSKPRITPLAESEGTEEQRKVLEPYHKEGRVSNVLGTLARHWDALKKFNAWVYHVMGETSTLQPRERELLILRIGWLCQLNTNGDSMSYLAKGRVSRMKRSFASRKVRTPKVGLRLTPPYLRAADELHADACISDATWAALSERYSTQQLMDVVFAVGQYTLVSMALNTFGVQLDKGMKGF